jgi:MFS family permease
MLIGSRALQGLGAAFISPAALSIISTTFEEGAERARALGVWAAIAIGGAAFGLVLGGLLTQLLSWPWIFFVNVPVGIVTFALALRLIPESRDEHANRSFDVAGAVSVTGGLMSLVYAIVKAETAGWGSATTIGFFTLSAILLASLLLVRLPVDGTYVANVLPSLIVTSLGMGAVFMPLTLIATTGLEDEDQGLASGLFNTSQQIGGALGLAILSTLAASTTASAGGATEPEALVTGFHWAFAGGAAFVLAGLVTMLVLLRRQHVARIEAEATAAPVPAA